MHNGEKRREGYRWRKGSEEEENGRRKMGTADLLSLSLSFSLILPNALERATSRSLPLSLSHVYVCEI